MLTIREVATPLHDAIRNSQLQGAHPLAGYPLQGRTQSARRLLLTMRIYIIQGVHPLAGYPLHRVHTIREEAAPYYEDIYYNP